MDKDNVVGRRSAGAYLDRRDRAVILLTCHLTISNSNELARRLFPRLRPGDNLATYVFLGASDSGGDGRPLCDDDAREQVVAALKVSIAMNDDDNELRRIVGKLSALSREFSTQWANVSDPPRSTGIVATTHPTLGHLSLSYDLLAFSDSSDLLIVCDAGATSTFV